MSAPEPDTRLRAIYNGKLGQWRLCRNDWMEKGETSTVAVILSSGDPMEDGIWAQEIARRFNEEATREHLNITRC